MKEKLEKIKNEILENLAKVKSLEEWQNLEVKYLGRKGVFTEILRSLTGLSIEERKTIGKLANDIKLELQENFKNVAEILEGKKSVGFVDPTLPGIKLPQGHIHPMTIVQNELEDLFISMGFMVLDGPEMESDYYNFEALNIPKHHPARDMQDTFYVDKKNDEGELDLVMRTQTSSMQVRAMQKYGAPMRCVIPGRCFRSEATDVRHEHTFYQLEGVMVGEGISLANMKSVLETVAKHLYGPETQVRLRPKFYPFVEPGANGEVTCFICGGKGCRLCKDTGWLEIFGSGMIHPNVLKAGGIDAKKYTGFAFGFGLTRLVMLKYGIGDIRLLQSDDLRFLEQF
ncbi:MAG: Phenylalanine-tRNA ligase alpha subunit [Parcubacteria group bacterium GW2011_GWE2_39_37]|uniref:Phenylalanine--tRNA ligase alpha subunit n=1 Tax=Candidatus Falkowbacteria bacterium GW2011_GWF2_39_8 TaxID=1618642 RepID=A0A0G0PYW0_9BACT|nr:MAG: Phenylalanine-tRNA ligase alpha subunit [Parcubacteria group bacterium GW2011_GWE2_39_37]KKR33339.1 MAG: Phenylalanine-tRNA ligase alpha subunit [Candidatus Falkowbacteria bacterium GW2011_GWF2_39_8]